MNKIKAKGRSSNQESESDESNQQAPNLDLSLMRQPIATSVTGFEEVLRAYEAGTNEVSEFFACLLNHVMKFFSTSPAKKIVIARVRFDLRVQSLP
jgi:hypothetical protein